jgi:recombination protein RecA
MGNQITQDADIKKMFPGIRTATEYPPVEVVKTPWPSLNNIVLGCGGIPRGRSIELYAPPSAGKTTVALNLLAAYHKLGLTTMWDDREGTFPGQEYTEPIGVISDEVTMMETGTGDDALFQAQLMFATNICDLYIIDSVANIMAEGASIAGPDGNFSMYDNFSQAKMLTTFYKRLRSGYYIGPPGTLKKDGTYNKGDMIRSDKVYIINGVEDPYLHKLQDKITTLITINHQKTKPGQTWGDATSVAGGDSGKFDASIRLRITYKKKSKKKDKFGSPEFKIIEIKADKNKVAPPFRSALFKLMRDGRLLEFDGNDSDTESAENDAIDGEGSGGVKFGKKKK